MTLKELTENTSTKYVDVRTENEFKTGHVKGAMNIPLDQIQYRFEEITGLGNIPVVFYCRSGNRSSRAVGYLRQMGIENIYNGGPLEDVQFYLN